MSIFSKLRLPYRNDSLFGLLFLIALLVPLAFDVYNFESFEVIKFGLLLLLIGFALLVFFKKYFSPNSPALVLRSNKTFFLALGLFIFWALVASLLALDKNYSFFGFYPRFTNGFVFYLLWSILFLLLAVESKAQLWALIKILFFCSGLVALWGLFQSVGWGYYGGQTLDFFARSAPSFLGNPNFSSMFIAALLPVGIYFLYTSKRLLARVYYAVSLFLQIWAVVIFASRGAILALLAGICATIFFSLILKRRVGGRFILLGAVCLLLSLGLSVGFLNFARPDTVAASLSLQETNIQTRLSVWSTAFKSILEKPVFGFGLGNFELFFESHRSLSSIKTGFFDDPHNLFLYLAITGGAPFLFLFLFLICYPAWCGLKKLFKNQSLQASLPAPAAWADGGQAAETAVILGAIAAWFTASFFTPVAIPCYVALAFLISALFTESFSYTTPKSFSLRIVGQIVGLVFIVCALCFITAEHLFFGSIQSYNQNDFSKSHSLVQAAVYLNPVNSLYYQYLAGSAARANFPPAVVEKNILKFSQFHQQRSYTYVQLANSYYLLLYQTNNPALRAVILQNLDRAISIDPFSSNNYFALSQYEFVFGNRDGAISSAKKGLSLDPKNLEARMFLAKIYQYEGNRPMLVEVLEAAIKNSDDKTNLLYLLKLAKKVPDIRDLPFKVSLSLGRLD
ncbi:MAG TPA: O-antigen ligase family protein [Candidatus Limnocylindria bacterium]|nr:O-antigen ligase family protein [Candidatus Limnocylindria bacterium]